jgi:hypothetical protein
LLIGEQVYDVVQLNSDPALREQAVKAIMENLNVNIDQNALYNYYMGVRQDGNPFNGLQNWFIVNKADKLTIVPGELEFTPAQVGLKKTADGFAVDPKHRQGMSVLGWYIQQGFLRTNVIGLANASTYFKDFEVVDVTPAEVQDQVENPQDHIDETHPDEDDSFGGLFDPLEPLARSQQQQVKPPYIDRKAATDYITRVLDLTEDQVEIAGDILEVT